MDRQIDPRVAFIHGRPKGHPIHALYAHCVKAKFFYEDFLLRWHDKPEALKIKRYLSWVLCAFFFPKKREYQVFLTECIRIPQLLMKLFGLMSREQKLIALMADESLYFLCIGKYPRMTSALMKLFLTKTDAIICIGQFQANLAKSILKPTHHKKIYTIYNGVPGYKHEKLRQLKPEINSNNILCIANATVEWRSWYKGIDLMIEAFSLAFHSNKRLKFFIVGQISDELIQKLVQPCNEQVKEAIIFTGAIENIETYMTKCMLYLHCSRGDAFPTTVLESMDAGLVPMISEDTGTVEIVDEVDHNLVTPVNSKIIGERINWFFNLGIQEKRELSSKCRKAIDSYTEENAVGNFSHIFNEIIVGLNRNNTFNISNP